MAKGQDDTVAKIVNVFHLLTYYQRSVLLRTFVDSILEEAEKTHHSIMPKPGTISINF